MAKDVISERLRKAITSCGVSRYRLAKDTGISESALSRFVSGKRGLDLASAGKLMDRLGMTLMRKRKITGVPAFDVIDGIRHAIWKEWLNCPDEWKLLIVPRFKQFADELAETGDLDW